MTKNLFDLTYEVAAEMGILQEGVCTGGSTQTIVDSVMLDQADDYWNKGTVWITYDAGGADAAPQGEYSTVTDSSSTGTTIVVSPGWSTATAASDRYAIAKGGRTGFQLNQIIGAVNRAVRAVGYVPVTNTTAIDTAAAQTEYTLPVAGMDLRGVWLQNVTSDTNSNEWYEARNWYVQKSASGSADTLVFQEQPPYPFDVKLVYGDVHPKLDISTDYLDESIHWERVIYKAAYYALAAFRFRTRSMDDYLLQHIEELKQMAQEADLKYPVRLPKKKGRIMQVGTPATIELAPGENKIT